MRAGPGRLCDMLAPLSSLHLSRRFLQRRAGIGISCCPRGGADVDTCCKRGPGAGGSRLLYDV